jgi:hypothetical protein
MIPVLRTYVPIIASVSLNGVDGEALALGL